MAALPGRDAGPVDAQHRHRAALGSRGHRVAAAARRRSTRSAASPWRWKPTSRCRSAQLVRIIEAVGSPALGVCLDPANCVAALELPRDVVTTAAPHVKNWHVKDFAFTRQAGWVGFNLVGCPLGEGLLDYDGIAQGRRPGSQRHQPDRRALAALAARRRDDLRDGRPMDTTQYQLSEEQIMTDTASHRRRRRRRRQDGPTHFEQPRRERLPCSLRREFTQGPGAHPRAGSRGDRHARGRRARATSSSSPSPTSCWARSPPTSFPP